MKEWSYSMQSSFGGAMLCQNFLFLVGQWYALILVHNLRSWPFYTYMVYSHVDLLFLQLLLFQSSNIVPFTRSLQEAVQVSDRLYCNIAFNIQARY